MATNVNVVGHKTYMTNKGDTWDSIAYQEYGNERYASMIMEVNRYHMDVLIFEGGLEIKVPIIEEQNIPSTLPPWRRDEDDDNSDNDS